MAEDQLAHGFCHEFSMYTASVRPRFDIQLFGLGGYFLLFGNEPVVLHTLNDVELPRPGAFGVDDGVVGGRCLGQASQHGGLRYRDVFQWLAKIGLGRSGETICPVAQKNLVHVNFENLVLGEQVFELEGEQNFVELARESLL